MNLYPFVSSLLIAVLSTQIIGCGLLRNVAMDSARPILLDQTVAMNREADYELAQDALPANIKLLEGLILSYPSRKDFKLWVCEALCGYGFGFVEDQDKQRASQLYLRAKDYAVSNAVKHTHFKPEYMYSVDDLQNWLQQRSKKDIDVLYWLGHSWGAYIALNLNDPEAMADLPKVQWIMERVIALDEGFYHAGAHVFLGSVYGSIPPMFGGSEDKSLAHFEQAFSLTEESFLLAYYYFAKTYCVRFQKKDAFDHAITHIEQASVLDFENLQLVNSIAKHKSLQLKQESEELFFDEEMYE